MKEICRVCFKVDPTIHFFSLTDDETRDLFEKCVFLSFNAQEDNYTHLCPECHYKCLEWRKFKDKAIKSHHRQMNVHSGTYGMGIEGDHCLVCQEETLATESHSLIDEHIREMFMDCTSIVLVKQEDISNQEKLCDECYNTCLWWSSFRSDAIEAGQKLKHLSAEKLNCRVEITRFDVLDMGLVTLDKTVKLEVEHSEWAEYSIDKPRIDPSGIKSEEPSLSYHLRKVRGKEGSLAYQSLGESRQPYRTPRKRTQKEVIHKPFKCVDCKRSFTIKSNFVRHQRIHKREKSFKCEECVKSFNCQSNLTEHRLIHISERPHKCEVCTMTFMRRNELINHNRIHKKEKSFKCEECGKSFNCKSNLAEHRLIHTSEQPHECEVCTRQTRVDFSTCENCSETFKQIGNLITKNQAPSGTFTRCDVCKGTFSQIFHLTIVQRIHTGEKTVKCEFCNESFSDCSSMMEHKRKPCVDYNYKKSFTIKSNFVGHKRIQTVEILLKCQLCSDSFRESGALEEHLRTHTGATGHTRIDFYTCKDCSETFKQFGDSITQNPAPTGIFTHCEVCTGTFSQIFQLSLLQQIHPGAKPFKCQLCSKAYSDCSSLMDHVRIHAAESRFKPEYSLIDPMRTHNVDLQFKCDVCSKSFQRSVALIEHKRFHTGEKPFKCRVCSMSFRFLTALKVHERVHPVERPFSCEKCNKSFRYSSSLAEHKRLYDVEK